MSRDADDLGRFGLGLKTSSFSQCRRLTVCTKALGVPVATRIWDLDHVAQSRQWQLLRTMDRDAELACQRLGSLGSGTVVIWQNVDRLVGGFRVDNDRDQRFFLEKAETVRDHLAISFHRMIGPRLNLKLLLNDREVQPWDPFFTYHPATQKLAATALSCRGEVVQVEPYVLPHHSKLTVQEQQAGRGPRGWNAHQGFYVYRNRRLLVAGDWLGLGLTKDEHHKLARIRVDVPTALDHSWGIDVTKSKATPPSELRAELRRIAERTREAAKRVFTHRGASLAPRNDSEREFLWERLAKHDRTFFRLNRRHPLIQHVRSSSESRSSFDALIRMIEATVPLPLIAVDSYERPDQLAAPFEQVPDSEVREVMLQMFKALIASGYGGTQAVDRLRTIWPFELFPSLLASLVGMVDP